MRGRRIKLLLGTVLLSCFFSGCGKENTNVTLGMSAIENLQYEEALADFDQAVLSGEDEQLINRGRGIAYIGLSDYESAIDCLILSLQKSNGHIEKLEYDTNFYLGLAYYKNGNYQEALDTYSSIITMDSNNEEAYFERGLSYLELGQVELSIKDFDKALSFDTKNYSRYIDIFCSLKEKGYLDYGNEYLERALAINDKKQTDYDKGRLYYYSGQYSEALSYFDSATRAAGGDAYLYLGKCYEALGDYNYAANVYLNFLSTQSDAQIYNQLGLCKMKLGAYDEALEAFQKGIALNDLSKMQSLRLNEITAYEYLGEFDQAKLSMANYLSTYSDDEIASREYSFLETR